MPILDPVSDAAAAPAAKDMFAKINSKAGLVPNFYRTIGHAPDVLAGTLAFDNALQTGLDPKLRELAYLKASKINGCDYCQHYHKQIGDMVGLSKEQIEGLGSYKESSAYSDLEKTAISFAEQFTRDARVDEGTMKKLKDGLGEANLVKLAATVAMANWTNRFNNTFKPELP